MTILPILETERLILRQPRQTEAERMAELLNTPEIAANTLRIPYPYPLEAAVQFIHYVQESAENGEDCSFGIFRREDNLFIGMISITPKATDSAEVGYWVGVPYWGQGYMTEALKRVIQYGFEDCKLNRIYAYYFAFNEGSRRVQEKAGMTFEGTLRQMYKKEEKYVDAGICAIIRDDWNARESTE